MPTDFAACSDRYVPLTPELIELYGYTGKLTNIPRNRSTQITFQGCQALCGNGTDWYPWEKQAGTLTTWIFPVIGIILQAPFMSNAFWATVFALARWIGNPMASLTAVLWNIKIAGKCALFVDMSVPYDAKLHTLTRSTSDFASIRDSFYLLNVMNQYTMRLHVRQKKEAEGLLRIVLFSKDLRLLRDDPTFKANEPMMQSDWRSRHESRRLDGANDLEAILRERLEPEGHLNTLRQKLADDLRATRKRGAVPVYLSLLWFLFSLAISIQAGFGLLGLNSEAHDLAMGCLLSWLPVLILCSVVDRNPINPEKIQRKLNKLIDRVRMSLMDSDIRELYLQRILAPEQKDPMRSRVEDVAQECNAFGDFFVRFAGQGRIRWHYGCAHPILKDIEHAYIAGKGRSWLHDEHEARTALVLGDVTGGLDWLDYRELWQVLAAVLIVLGTILGAFFLSFFTPTAGLGCRSGGYMIYAILALTLLVSEMAIWWAIDSRKARAPGWLTSERRRRDAIVPRGRDTARMRAAPRQSNLQELLHAILLLAQLLLQVLGMLVPSMLSRKMRQLADTWSTLDVPQKLQWATLRPVEAVSAGWLFYIVCAQTFGIYNKCSCKTSSWSNENYLDLLQSNAANNAYVQPYWIAGTVISVSTMAIALAYVVLQWCLQSHLNTLDADSAAKGLRRVRRFRYLTSPVLRLCRLPLQGSAVCLRYVAWPLGCCGITVGGGADATLRWTKETPEKPDSQQRLPGIAAADAPSELQHFKPVNLGGVNGEGAPLVVPPETAYLYSPVRSHASRSSNEGSLSPAARDAV